TITFTNTKAEELFNKKKKGLIGRYIWEIYSEPVRTPGVEAINNALTQKLSSQVDYFSIFFQTTVSLRITTLKQSIILLIHKEPRGANSILNTVEDSTAQKKTECALETVEALRESEQQLKRLLKLRDEFIGIASHELKTPVTSIKAYAQMLQITFKEKEDVQ